MADSNREYIVGMKDGYLKLGDSPAIKKLKGIVQNVSKILAEDIYENAYRFSFELIQNAEDNKYKHNVKPTIEFHLTKVDPISGRKQSSGVLIVKNNEMGFSRDDIDSICDIGASKKTKSGGYLGEKGIGFKSVFRITSCPHIISNGFSFSLPEEDEDAGLGYIVPNWHEITEYNYSFDPNYTYLILPLDKEHDYDATLKLLNENIHPEVILFLRKIKHICVSSDEETILDISKSEAENGYVELIVKSGIRNPFVKKYLTFEQTFTRPSNIVHAKRDVDLSTVTVAFPILEGREKEIVGKLFAYLPVYQDTKLPFIINADFVLASNRQGVVSGEKWNEWLRDCAVDTYCDAIWKWSQVEEYKDILMNFVPVTTYTPFLNPIIKQICSRLSHIPIVPTEPNGMLAKPTDSIFDNKIDYLYRVLDELPQYPKILENILIQKGLFSKHREALEEISKLLKMRNISKELIKESFSAEDWFFPSTDWFKKSLILTQRFDFIVSDYTDIKDHIRVPAIMNGAIDYYSVSDEPVLLSDSKIDSDVDINTFFKDIKILDPSMEKYLSSNVTLKENLILSNIITEYNADYFARRFNRMFTCWSDREFIEQSGILLQFAGRDFDLSDLPVLLEDGSRMKASVCNFGIHNLVTPRDYDSECGWQRLFVSESDCAHLYVMSNLYCQFKPDMIEKFCRRVGAKAYPLLPGRKYKLYECTDDEQRRITEGRNERDLGLYKLHIPEEALKPDSKAHLALLSWVEHSKRFIKSIIIDSKDALLSAFENEQLHKQFQSIEWLETTKGLNAPQHTFFYRDETHRILKDWVPYLKGDWSRETLQFLGIKYDFSIEDLVEYLKTHPVDENDNGESIKKIYETLAGTLDDDEVDNLAEAFAENEIIFSPDINGNSKWVKSSDAIWKDRSELFGNEFTYLQKHYSELKNFFVDIIHVKEDAEIESYCNYWLKLQTKKTESLVLVESMLTPVYEAFINALKDIGSLNTQDWWISFIQDVMILTKQHRFAAPSDVYLADDGLLESIFQSNANFAWVPSKKTYKEWEPIYRALHVKTLSSSVRVERFEAANQQKILKPNFLTDSAKVLILTYIKMERNRQYEFLREHGLIDLFLNSIESTATDISVLYKLGAEPITRPENAIWKSKPATLLYINKKANKQDVANVICNSLAAPGTDDALKTLETIEVYLGEEDYSFRINRKATWKIPAEVKKWLDGRSVEIETAEIVDSVIKSESSETGMDAIGKANQGVHNEDPIALPLNPTDTNKNENENLQDSLMNTGAGENDINDLTMKGIGITDDPTQQIMKQKDNYTNDVSASADQYAELSQQNMSSNSGNDINLFSKNDQNLFGLPHKHKIKSLSKGNGAKSIRPRTRNIKNAIVSVSSDSEETYEIRTEIEYAAIEVILQSKEAQNYICEKMEPFNEGYDVCFKNNQTGEIEKYIEVKSFENSWENASLTRAQMEMARVERDKYWIYVVEFARQPEKVKVYPIRDPLLYITRYTFDSGWKAYAKSEQQEIPKTGIYKKGSRVRHSVLKREGIIESIKPCGETQILNILFDDEQKPKPIPANVHTIEILEE